MNRHLHNTVSALVASGSLLVMGLIAAAPLVPPQDAGVPTQSLAATEIRRLDTVASVAMTAEVAAATVLVSAIGQAAGDTLDSAQQTKNSRKYRRQALVMPYLSFVPRG